MKIAQSTIMPAVHPIAKLTIVSEPLNSNP